MSEELNILSEELNILEDFPPNSHEEWLGAVDKQLKGKPFDKVLVKQTYEGINIQPMYFQHDLEKLDHVDFLPDEVPYVRGTKPSMYITKSWDLAQEICEPDPEQFNAAARHDLSRGQNALNFVFDKATKSGLNPGQAQTEDVGKNGLSMATMQDLAQALDEIDISDLPILANAGNSNVAVTALFGSYLKQQGKSFADLKGCIFTDPMGILASEGKFLIPFENAYDEMAQLTVWAKENAPNLKTIGVCSDIYQNSGGNAVQEAAFAVATGVEYIRQMQERGLGIDDIAPQMMFVFSIGPDFFMEIAKFRAVRMVWNKIIDAFGGNDESKKMVIHGKTSTWNKTVVDPWVNMLRVSTETFSGIAGGCDSLHVSPYDEIIRTPNEFSRRIARNVQIVLRDEAHFDKVIDPAGGCWYVETITYELSQKIWQLFQEVEKQGGILKSLQQGFPQEQTAAIAAKKAKNIAIRKDRFVGTNMYPNITETPVEAEEFDHDLFKSDRNEQIASFIASVDKDKCKEILMSLNSVKGSISSDLLNTAIDAALAGATLGDITQILRQDLNQETSVNPLNIHRGAEKFEVLRRATEAYTNKTGSAPKLFLVNMGPIPQHKPRAEFSTGFFSVGAFDVVGNNGFKTVEDAVKATLESGAKAVVICSTDATYPELVPPLAKQIKEADSGIMIILAGYPKDYIEQFKEAGVDEFLHMRSNALELLGNLQKHLGVI